MQNYKEISDTKELKLWKFYNPKLFPGTDNPLSRYLRNNHYSKIVDLEEENLQIAQFYDYDQQEDSMTYVEIDAAFKDQCQEIMNTMAAHQRDLLMKR